MYAAGRAIRPLIADSSTSEVLVSHRRLTLVALPLTVVWTACAHPAPRAKSDADVVIAAPGSDPVVRDQDIAFYQKRLLEDPESAADRSRLALLFLARSREAGNFADVQRAESLAIESLHLRESHNSGTFTILASARLASHDFRGALVAARRLVATDPTSPTSRALLGEILLEIGQSDEEQGKDQPCRQPPSPRRPPHEGEDDLHSDRPNHQAQRQGLCLATNPATDVL